MNEYQDPIEPTSLSANVFAVLPEVVRTLKFRREQTVILAGFSQDCNRVLKDKNNKTIKFHRLYKSMDEDMDTFKNVVKLDKSYGKSQQMLPLEEDERPSGMSEK